MLRLPTEVLGCVLLKLKPAEWKVLRLTNKTISTVVSPLLFSRLVLDPKHPCNHSKLSFLEALASEKSNGASSVQTLEVMSLGPPRHTTLQFWKRLLKRHQRTYRNMEKLLFIAIPCFTSVTSIILDMSVMRYITAASEDRIMKSLSSLPSLSHLSLLMHREVGSSLPRAIARHFKDLESIHFAGDADCYSGVPKVLIANSPAIRHLSVDSSIITASDLVSRVTTPLKLQSIELGSASALFLDNVSAIAPHVTCLSSFVTSESVHIPADFWCALTSSDVQLEKLSVHYVDGALLDYLQSYSGLVDLSLSSGTLEDTAPYDALADTFYHHVLPHHVATLKSLRISTPHDGPWCLEDSQVDDIIACHHLSVLHIVIGSSEAGPLNVITQLLDSACDGELPLRFLAIASAPPRIQTTEDPILSLYSAHGIREHHRINELISQYFCSSPSATIMELEVSTGHMHHSRLVPIPEQNGLWHFELQRNF